VLGSELARPTFKRKSTLYDRWPLLDGWSGPTMNLEVDDRLHEAAYAVTQLSRGDTNGVILMGSPGCGKTLLANILLWAAGGAVRTVVDGPAGVRSVWSAVFYAEPDLLDQIRDSYSYNNGLEQLVRKVNNAQLLILDDLGAGYVKDGSEEWYTSLIWRFLNERQDKRTLITTNLQPAEIKTRIGDRAMSRIKEMLGERTYIVDLFGVPDYRGNNW